LTACPVGYTNSSNICVLSSNNPNNTDGTIVQSSGAKIVPFPFTIGLAVSVILIMLSKFVLSFTIVSAVLCGFIGIL
jgi:uncharacterized membrane protein